MSKSQLWQNRYFLQNSNIDKIQIVTKHKFRQNTDWHKTLIVKNIKFFDITMRWVQVRLFAIQEYFKCMSILIKCKTHTVSSGGKVGMDCVWTLGMEGAVSSAGKLLKEVCP